MSVDSKVGGEVELLHRLFSLVLKSRAGTHDTHLKVTRYLEHLGTGRRTAPLV